VTKVLPVRETLDEIVDPAHTALVVIDIQNDFCQPLDCQAMIPRVERLLAAAREAGVYVVYIQNTVAPDGATNSPSEISRRRKHGMRTEVTVDGTWGQRIVEQLAPRPNDPVVRKHRMNSFVGTDLDMLLRCHGIETVVCTGTATHGCVLNTTYAALNFDYYVVVVRDCIAGPRRDLHDLALGLMSNAMHGVVDAEELVALWQAKASAQPESLARSVG
jgi:ureidoacrylate peracid hydrolase